MYFPVPAWREIERFGRIEIPAIIRKHELCRAFEFHLCGNGRIRPSNDGGERLAERELHHRGKSGCGTSGLYYYFHTMSKALSLSGIESMRDSEGKKRDWRKELSLKLLNMQNPQGFWLNENGRWWERDPVLVTSYALLSLERIYFAL